MWRLSPRESFSCVAILAMFVGAIELSRATYRKMIQNLVWATAYNLVAIPVAGGLFVRWGFDLPMSVGAVAMSLSTIIVSANAQLLRRVKLQRETR
jgi:Cu2+-exporting ATPase